MKQIVVLGSLLGLLYGCAGGGYLPYAAHSMSPAALDSLVSSSAKANGLPVGLVHAVVMAESGGDPSALSGVGAQGLMQLMPGTSAGCRIANAFDPNQNVACGTSYLRSMINHYHGNVTLAVAAYNAGPGAVDKYHGVPPYAETRAYVVRVLNAYRNY